VTSGIAGRERFNTQMGLRLQGAIELLCKRWTLVMITTLLGGPRRFSEISRTLEVVSDRMLSERLKELEGAGIVRRHVVTTSPIQVSYELTEKGHGLVAAMEAIGDWAGKWLQDDARELAGKTWPKQGVQLRGR
jgi:DNA-binding HxlR family transcriptional regulator